MLRISQKNQKLIFSLVILLVWIIFIPRDIEPEKPKENQNQAIEEAAIASDSAQANNFQKVKVVRVVDGDTIEIEGGQKVRYIGINTPETVDPRLSPQCFGKEASLKNKELVEGKEVYLEKDISEVDKYGRLLRYLYLDQNGISLNEQLVREGYAVSSSYPPDIKYQDRFKLAETEARNQQKGLWNEQTCPVTK